MATRHTLALALTWALLSLNSCQDAITPTHLSADDAQYPLSSITSSATADDAFRPDEVQSRRFSRQILGFGGFAYDTLGNIHLFLKDQRDEHAIANARNALNPLLSEWGTGARRQRLANARVLIRVAQYTFDELRGWRDRLADALLELDGVTFVDLDEARNRLTIGLNPMQASATRALVTDVLTRAGVPEAAVAFELLEPFAVKPVSCLREDPTCTDPCTVDSTDPSCTIDPCSANPSDPSCNTDPCTLDPGDPACTPDPCTDDQADPTCTPSPEDPWYGAEMPSGGYYGGAKSLRERIRPVQGGTEFWSEHRDRSGALTNSICSVGFAAKAYGSVPVWVTASHCTGLIGTSYNIPFFQGPWHFGKSGLYVGSEYSDPAFGSNAGGTQTTIFGSCKDRVKCRRSDIALIRAGNPSEWELNFIARPVSGVTGYGNAGSLLLNQNSPPLRINLERGTPTLSSRVDKIGRSSGWTYGTVTKTCLDTKYVGPSNDPNPTNIVIRCQAYVDCAYAEGGDSGAPVFILKSGSLVTLLGIVWAANNQGFVFSSLDLIRLDLGFPTTDRTSLQTYR
jgi:hypothetical protein